MGVGNQSLEKVDETLQNVMDWGTYQAAAYRVLVAEGPLEARDVVVRTDIPQGRIYDVLNSLHREGVIDKQEANPARYRAQNPGEILDEKTQEIEAAQESLVTAQELSQDEETSEPAWVLGGQAGIVRKIRELAAQAEESFLAVESDPRWYTVNDMRMLRRYADEGLDVDVIVWNARQAKLEELQKHGVSVRVHEEANKSFYVIDREYVVMKISRQSTGIVFRDRTMATTFIREFKELSDNAKEPNHNAS